jgi:hypothetical protein
VIWITTVYQQFVLRLERDKRKKGRPPSAVSNCMSKKYAKQRAEDLVKKKFGFMMQL